MLFTFGCITDVQHADLPDGASFGGVPRYYRSSLTALRCAVDDWLAQPPRFVVQLGDIIDGKAVGHSERALGAVLREFGRLRQIPVYHTIGNHCLYNFRRAALNADAMLGIAALAAENGESGCSYFAFRPHAGFRFVVIDGYDVSMLGWPTGHPKHELAAALLEQHNPNQEKNDPNPMEGPARRYVKFGGGLGEQQVAWLRTQLEAAAANGERVVVCCHLPLHPDSANGACLLWNYREVLELLQTHTVVVATLSGHAHKDGYVLDEAGLHHRVLNCVVETRPGEACHGTVEVHADRLELRGEGALGSASMPFRPLLPVPAAALPLGLSPLGLSPLQLPPPPAPEADLQLPTAKLAALRLQRQEERRPRRHATTAEVVDERGEIALSAP